MAAYGRIFLYCPSSDLRVFMASFTILIASFPFCLLFTEPDLSGFWAAQWFLWVRFKQNNFSRKFPTFPSEKGVNPVSETICPVWNAKTKGQLQKPSYRKFRSCNLRFLTACCWQVLSLLWKLFFKPCNGNFTWYNLSYIQWNLLITPFFILRA
jgi:hypothetical protein